jgi:hypothetical protein
LKSKIIDFFKQRKIDIIETFVTCGETVDSFADVEKYNNAVAEMILKVATTH